MSKPRSPTSLQATGGGRGQRPCGDPVCHMEPFPLREGDRQIGARQFTITKGQGNYDT